MGTPADGADGTELGAEPLHDSFDGPDFSPEGGLYYRDNFEQSAGTCAFQKDVKLSGTGAAETQRQADRACRRFQSQRTGGGLGKDRPARAYGGGRLVWFAVKFAYPIPYDESSLRHRAMEA